MLEKTSWNSCIVSTGSSLNHIKFWKEDLTEVNDKQFTSDFSVSLSFIAMPVILDMVVIL